MCQTSFPRLSSWRRTARDFRKPAVQLRCCIGQVHARSQKPRRLWKHVPYGRESEGLHLPPVPEALNRACPDIKSGKKVIGEGGRDSSKNASLNKSSTQK